ncbi:hypothetical protein BKA59DRAFT_483041 [Fusarium tricinctum]|uniref:Uncharacterized protein n=1 Tax=Fusarium tricinctum TaxID=61284 RepID=A0A8K0RNE0_9HYPO|nr:hypothetical protein BKA59DRAFT_483041 [Fusarium tricinctum]
MGRRDTYSEPPRNKRQPYREPPHRDPRSNKKECGFDWTPGIALALVGAITWLSRDFDSYKKKHDGHEVERRNNDSDRGRRRHRSGSRYPDDGYDDYYRRDRGYSQ